MTDTRKPSAEELHGYVDGQISPTDELRVEAWLADNPEEATAVHAYRLQNARLHDTFDTVLEEDVPVDLSAVVRGRKMALDRRPAPWARVAASVALLLFGGLAGWLLRDWQVQGARSVHTAFVNHALGAHRIFVKERRHPVEVPSSQQAHLVKWLSNRLGRSLRAPDLTSLGFELVGGRLLAEGALPAAQFMYQNPAGARLTVYVRAADGTENTAFRYVSDTAEGDNSAFYWIDRDFAYALVAPLERAKLMPLANAIFEAQQEAP